MNNENRQAIVLFDGDCTLCCGFVNFIIHRDQHHRFGFVPVQSITGRSLLEKYYHNIEWPDALVLIEKGIVYHRSTAVLKIVRQLERAWPLLFLFIAILPSIRDFIYTVVAKNRYRLFGNCNTCLLQRPRSTIVPYNRKPDAK